MAFKGRRSGRRHKERRENRVNQLIRLLIENGRSSEIERPLPAMTFQESLFQEFCLLIFALFAEITFLRIYRRINASIDTKAK